MAREIRPSSRAIIVGAAATFTILAVAFTWPLAANLATELPVGGDNLHLGWVLAWTGHAVATAPRELFDGNIFYPARGALTLSDPSIVNGLLLAPLAALSVRPAVLVNVLLMASFPLCGLSALLLARSWGASAPAAIACGALFAFSPLRLGRVDHVQLLASWWIPLSLFGYARFLERGRTTDVLLATAAVILEAYTSIYLLVFQLAALGLLLLTMLFRGEIRVAFRRALVWQGAAATVAALVCLPLGAALDRKSVV